MRRTGNWPSGQNLAFVDQIKSIAPTAFVGDGIKRRGDRPEFRSYSLHMNLQVVTLTDVGGSPDAFQQFFVRDNVWVVLDELCQQLVPQRCERDFLTPVRYFMCGEIEPQAFFLEGLLLRYVSNSLSAAERGAKSGQQLHRRKRLRDLVVGAELETFDLVHVSVTRSQHHDGYF